MYIESVTLCINEEAIEKDTPDFSWRRIDFGWPDIDPVYAVVLPMDCKDQVSRQLEQKISPERSSKMHAFCTKILQKNKSSLRASIGKVNSKSPPLGRITPKQIQNSLSERDNSASLIKESTLSFPSDDDFNLVVHKKKQARYFNMVKTYPINREQLGTNHLNPMILNESTTVSAQNSEEKCMAYNLSDLKSCILEYLENRKICMESPRFSNQSEDFVFKELAMYLMLLTPREVKNNSFEVRIVLGRSSFKSKKKLKMFQMIYCKVVKHLHKEFTVKNQGTKRSQFFFRSNFSFFSYYFQNVASQHRRSVDDYNHFTSAKNSNLYYDFFSKVFESGKFKADFLSYLRGNFMTDFQVERKHRVNKLFDRWEAALMRTTSLLHSLKEIQNEIRGPRFKFVLDDRTIGKYISKFDLFIESIACLP